MPTPTPIQEFVDSRGQTLRVDAEAGVLRGVKLLGLESHNGRRYREQALADAVALYEGAKVNVNHPQGSPLAPRDYRDRIGAIHGVRFKPGDGLFGDLHYNPKHPLAEQLAWDARHAARNVGLSHNVLANISQEEGRAVVEAIVKVQSVDLVADPATTRGLFEQQAAADKDTDATRPTANGSHASSAMSGAASDSALETGFIPWDSLTLEQLELQRPDLAAQMRRDESDRAARQRAEVEAATVREAVARRQQRIIELLVEHRLPLPGGASTTARQIVSQEFLDSLAEAPTEEALEERVRARAELVRAAGSWSAGQGPGGPRSRESVAIAQPNGAGGVQSASEFAAAVRR